MGMYLHENPYSGKDAHFLFGKPMVCHSGSPQKRSFYGVDFGRSTLVQDSTQPTRGRPLAGGVIHYTDVPLRFETFSSADQAKIRPRRAALHYQSSN